MQLVALVVGCLLKPFVVFTLLAQQPLNLSCVGSYVWARRPNGSRVASRSSDPPRVRLRRHYPSHCIASARCVKLTHSVIKFAVLHFFLFIQALLVEWVQKWPFLNCLFVKERHLLLSWLVALSLPHEVLNWVAHDALGSRELSLSVESCVLNGNLLTAKWAGKLFLYFLVPKNLFEHENHVVLSYTNAIHKHLATQSHIFQSIYLEVLVRRGTSLQLSFHNVPPAHFDSV